MRNSSPPRQRFWAVIPPISSGLYENWSGRLINLAKSDTTINRRRYLMNRFKGSKSNVCLSPVLLLFTLAVFMMNPMEMVRLYAQPTLSEVIQDSSEEEVKEEKAVKVKGPEDEFGRGTPRSSAKGFFAVIEKRDFETAAEYLDLRRLPRKVKKNPRTGVGSSIANCVGPNDLG